MEASANHQLPLVGSHSRNDLIDQRWFPSPNHDENKKTMGQNCYSNLNMNTATSSEEIASQAEIPTKELKELVKAFHEASEYMKTNAKYEDTIIFVGNTRSGKSTLINALIGNRLKAERIGKRGAIALSLADDQSTGPEIGNGSTSKTAIPFRWTSSIIPLTIWDVAGIDDSRGPMQDIINAFYIFLLIRKVKSLKVIVVIDVNDILHDNVKPFLSVLNGLENLLGRQMQMFSSISVVFSKVPDFINDIPVNIELITEILKEQFLSDKNFFMTPLTKDFLINLIQNVDRIAVFKNLKPNDNFLVSTNEICQVINNSTSFNVHNLKEFNISVADSSENFLFKARTALSSITNFGVLQEILHSACKATIKDLNERKLDPSNVDEVKTLLEEYYEVENKLLQALNKNDLKQKLEFLQSFHYSVKEKIENDDFLEKVDLLEFVDKILNMKASVEESLNIQKILFALLNDLRMSNFGCQLKNKRITKKNFDELLKNQADDHKRNTDELRERLRNAEKENRERIGFFKNLGAAMNDLIHFRF